MTSHEEGETFNLKEYTDSMTRKKNSLKLSLGVCIFQTKYVSKFTVTGLLFSCA